MSETIKDTTTPVQAPGEQQATTTPEGEWTDQTRATLLGPRNVATEEARQSFTADVRAAMAAPHNGVDLSALSPEERQQVLDARFASMQQILDEWAAMNEQNEALNVQAYKQRLLQAASNKRTQLTQGTTTPTAGTGTTTAGAVMGPVVPGIDISGDSTTAIDPTNILAPGPRTGSVDLSGPTVGQADRPATTTRPSGPLFVTPQSGQDHAAAVREGLTERLGFAPHRDVVRLVAENANVLDDGRISIPDRDGIVALYAATYGIDPSQGRVVIAGENDRYADVLEDNFNFGPEGVPDWGARGLLIRTIMTMNGMQPRHNLEMPGVVVIPNDEAHFAELALAENGYAGQETRRFTGQTIDPADQAQTVAGYLLRLRGQDPSDPALLAQATAEVEEMLAHPSTIPSGGEEMRAYTRTAADSNERAGGQQWPRDAILEAYKDLFDPEHPQLGDIPRDRLAAMIMMTVAQTNNLDPESFGNCSQIVFINSDRMASLIHDARSGDESSHFASLDAMANDLDKLQGIERNTAEMWQTIVDLHAPGSGQVARRMRDGRPMPIVLIDSAAAMQPLSQEDMERTEGLLMQSAYTRGLTENPIPIPFIGFNIGGIVEMARVMAAAHGETDTTARRDGESVLEHALRTGPELSERETNALRRQIERAMPRVRAVIGELEAAGSGEGWRWENDRLVLDDVAAFRETVASMPLSAANREALLSWLDESFAGADLSGMRTIDIERLGALSENARVVRDEGPRESQSGGIINYEYDLPPSYYQPSKEDDKYDNIYLYDAPSEFSPNPSYYEETNGFMATIEKMDLRVASVRHSSDEARVQLAQNEIREHAVELRTYIADLRSDTEKYQETITRMNRLISQWEAQGKAEGGPLTSFLLAELSG